MRDRDQAADRKSLMDRRAIHSVAALSALVGVSACENREAHEASRPSYLPVLATALVLSDLAAVPVAAAAESLTYSGELTQGGWITGRVPEGTISARLGETELTLDQQGHFFAAFDRDAGGEARLVAELANGSLLEQPLEISARAWNIEHVDVARRPGTTSEAFLERRRPELAAIYAAREQATGAEGWRQKFIWPVKGRISGRFGSQRIYKGEPGSYHSGLDIAPGEGTPFVAPADGVVVLAADDFSLEGKLLIIDHGQGLNSAFLHASKLVVAEGDEVKQGQHIGNVGASGRATGPHLHWSIKWRDARLDPLLFVGPQG